MNRTPAAMLAVLAASHLGLAACSDSGTSSSGDTPWHLSVNRPSLDSAALGVKVELTPESAQDIGYNDDGSISYDVEGIVTLASGESRHVAVTEDLENVASGARQTLVTEDLTSEEIRWFHYDPEDNAVVIGDELGGVFVFQNPDGSYDVVTSLFDDPVDEADYTHAEDGYAAWELVQDYNQFQTTSKYSLLMVYALAQLPALASRSPIDCSSGSLATPPAVCQTFKAFCDCVACYAADQGENCALCAPPAN